MNVNFSLILEPLRSARHKIACRPRRFLTSSKLRGISVLVFEFAGSLTSISFSTTSLIRRKLLRLNSLKEHTVFSKLDGLEMASSIFDGNVGGVADECSIFKFGFS